MGSLVGCWLIWTCAQTSAGQASQNFHDVCGSLQWCCLFAVVLRSDCVYASPVQVIRMSKRDVLQLPSEVIQHIYSVKLKGRPWNGVGETVLSLKDRLRALAVCTTWKACLDPRRFPVEGDLRLNSYDDEDQRIVCWVASTGPALRALSLSDHECRAEVPRTLLAIPSKTLKELSLHLDWQVLQNSLAAIRSFTGLEGLGLDVGDSRDSEALDLAALQPLLALKRLHCSYGTVELRGGPLLPQLTRLEFFETNSVVMEATLPSLQHLLVFKAICGSAAKVIIDAALPSLQTLSVSLVDELQLAGEHLQLPQLTHLALWQVNKAAINWPAVHQLVDLRVDTDFPDIVIPSLPSLSSLTSLALSWGRYSHWQVAKFLQAAPPSLRHLSLGPYVDWSRPPPFHLVPQLTGLACTNLKVLQHLGSLTQLQRLEFANTANALTPAHIERLGCLTTLRLLRFGLEQLTAGDAALRHIQELKDVLPAGCMLEQPEERPAF